MTVKEVGYEFAKKGNEMLKLRLISLGYNLVC